MNVKLPWNSGTEPAADAAAEASTDLAAADAKSTPGKGRPTPKRREAENRKRGPVAPPPTTRAEARARRKEQKQSLSKEERKELRAERSAQRQKQHEAMNAGDERYMLARDKGPVRKMARDIVDSRRNVAGLFMPIAILIIVSMMIPQLAVYMNLLMLVFIIVMIIDLVLLGRNVNKRVRERYPETTDTGFRLGMYAGVRAMQLRMMRQPKPQVSLGDKV